METLTAAILGVIQGLTEFLPISSSAHLILVPWIFGWAPEGIVFDVSLHVGTAVAIGAYFWQDWARLIKETVQGILEGKPLGNAQRRLAWFLFAATVPAMLAGLGLEKVIEQTLRSPVVTVGTLMIFGLVLYLAERLSKQGRSLEQVTLADALWIGVSQTLALVPGVSRSGITISAGLLRNMDRSSAARFSFLLATPVIVGAGVLEGWRFMEALRDPGMAGSLAAKWPVFAAGVLAAAVSGFLCIHYFLRYIQKNTFVPFVLYRFGLAVIVLLLYLKHTA